MPQRTINRFGLLLDLLIAVKKFSDKIRMEFAFGKCAKSTLDRGKLAETPDL